MTHGVILMFSDNWRQYFKCQVLPIPTLFSVCERYFPMNKLREGISKYILKHEKALVHSKVFSYIETERSNNV